MLAILLTPTPPVAGRRNQMKTINIIPADYSGDPKKALGYAWTDLVMDGYKVDHVKSTPGEDIVGDYQTYINLQKELEKEFGQIVVINPQDYSARDLERAGDKIAILNCMWCGGANSTVYKKITAKNKAIVSEDTNAEMETQIQMPDPLMNVKGDRKKKEIVYDNIFNEGAEGYNPYRD